MRLSLRLIALALTALPSLALAQVNYDTVQVRTQNLAPGIFMLIGSGGNIGLAVGEDAVFVIDDQFAPLTPKILAAIAAITPKPVRFVINTHWHFDHTGGNENIGKTGAVIVAHDNVRRRMAAGQLIEAIGRTEPPAPKGALPIVTFAEGVTFHINGDSVAVTHMPPAHTDGDSFVFFTKANVLHMGDMFLSAGLPFVDLSSGGSINGVIGTAERVISITNATTKIIPGHGPLADRARLMAWRDMLVALRDRMRTEVRAGKTLDQVVAANITAPYASAFPGGHARFVQLLYQELSRR